MNHCDTSQIPHGLSRRDLGRDHERAERFRLETVERFDGLYRDKARIHNTGRNEAVAELLSYLSLLRSANAIRQQAGVNWDRAHYQSFKASEGRNAAHVLPCQLLIDNARPSDVVVPALLAGPRIQYRLRELFGQTTSLPKVFNAADSRAEDHCLRGALVHAAEAVIRQTQPIQRGGGVLRRGTGENFGEIERTVEDRPEAARVGIDAAAVRGAYQVWSDGAGAAFDRAIAAVEARGATVDARDASEEVIYILGQYRAYLNQPPYGLSDQNLSELEMRSWA